MNKNEKIIKKVQGLLAISRDNKNDEESQSAFILAQKLMIKHSLSDIDVEDYEVVREREKMNYIAVTAKKRLYWWEKTLARTISKNFRTKNYLYGYGSKYEIRFFGYGSDLELAREMYILAYDAVLQHSKAYINEWYKEHFEEYQGYRERYITESIKSSYLNGFLSGLDSRFEEQVALLQKEYALMVLIPEEVEEEFSNMSADWRNTTARQAPDTSSIEAFYAGRDKANSIDFTKSTIGEDIDED